MLQFPLTTKQLAGVIGVDRVKLRNLAVGGFAYPTVVGHLMIWTRRDAIVACSQMGLAERIPAVNAIPERSLWVDETLEKFADSAAKSAT